MRRALMLSLGRFVVLSVSVLVTLISESPSVAQGPDQAGTRPPGETRTMLPDGRLLYLGGMNGLKPQSGAEIVDPRTSEIVRQPAVLRHARAWHTATVLPDGKVLLLGGVGLNQQFVGSVEILDPGTLESVALGGEATTVRAHHSATLLTDGDVLIVGGVSSSGELLELVELWNPQTRQATRISTPFDPPRRDHRAVLRRDGTVLVSGGTDPDNARFEFGEVYYPETQRFHVEPLRSEKHKEADDAYLEDSIPTNGSTEVAVDGWVSLRFSTLVDPESVNSESIRLEGPEGVIATQRVVAEEGRLAFITPNTALLPESSYRMSIAGVMDQEGRAVPPTGIIFRTVKVPDEEERWIPELDDFTGDWTSGRSPSPWEKAPPLLAGAGVTALAGQVLALHGRPLANVTVQLGERATRTDPTGRFLLAPVSAGAQPLTVDGRSANQPGKAYGMFIFKVEVADGQTSVLPYTVWMPLLDTDNATSFPSPTPNELVAGTPLMPGLEVHVPRGAVLEDIDGKAVTSMTITPLPIDRPPFPIPTGVRFPVYFTLQPGGAAMVSDEEAIRQGMRIVFPNYAGFPAESRVDFWSYDPRDLGWFVYGKGQVTQDGMRMVPDSGVTIRVLTCAALGPPNDAAGIASPPGNEGAEAGDPVDLGTGLFVYSKTDIVLPDVMPIVFTRTYRQNDSASRPFGIASTHSYEWFLVGDQVAYSYAELILPDGGRVRYDSLDPNITNYQQVTMEHTKSPTPFFKSTLSWNNTHNGWDLRLRDGMVYEFLVDLSPEIVVLKAIQDRYGSRVEIIRDSAHRISKITSPNNRWLEFTLQSPGDPGDRRIKDITDNIGRIVHYTYDAQGRLATVTDPEGGVTTYAYEGSTERLTTIEDARGIVYLTNMYDSVSGRIERQTLADPNVEYQFSYTIDGGTGKITQTDVTDPRGNIRRLTFNADGYMTSDTYALGDPSLERTTTYGRGTGTNLVTSVTDEFNRVTGFTYQNGQVDTITRLQGTPNAVTTDIDYEPNFGLVSKITDPLGHQTTFEYDGVGNLTGIIDAESIETQVEYNSAGQPTKVFDPNGEVTELVYELGDLVEVIDPLFNGTRAFADAVGRVKSITDAAGSITRYDYDGLNQLTAITDHLDAVTEFTYDGNGNMLTVKDARENIVTYRYDLLDRLETRTDALGDPANPLADPNHYEEYEYDGNGNLIRHTDRRGKTTTLRYDALDRLEFAGFGTQGVEPNLTYESTIDYLYDDPNNRVTLTDSETGAVVLEYDNLGRLTKETTPNGSVSYAYDGADRLNTLTVLGQPTVVYDYFDNDQLKTVTQGTKVVNLDYYPTGLRKTLSLPNSISTTYSFDVASRLTGLLYKHDTTTLGDLGYSYEARGLRTSVDGAFARTGLPDAVASTSYDAANRLTQWGSISNLTYDNNGNLTFDGTKALAWNARNQLESITGGVSFEYDPLGRRSSKEIGDTTDILFSRLNVIKETTTSAESDLLLGLGIDEFFMRSDGSEARMPLADGLGSIVALLDPNGELSTEYTYEPFGATSINGSDTNSFQFTGREHDDLDRYYHRARYYSAKLHRFLSEDPIGPAGGDANLYRYVRNSPTNFIDPSGLHCGNPVSWPPSLPNLPPPSALDLPPLPPPTSGRKPPPSPQAGLFGPGPHKVDVTIYSNSIAMELTNLGTALSAVVRISVSSGGLDLGGGNVNIDIWDSVVFQSEGVYTTFPHTVRVWLVVYGQPGGLTIGQYGFPTIVGVRFFNGGGQCR